MHADPHQRGWSSLELSRALTVPLSNVSYHVACLRDAGVLVQAGRAQRRGAIERFYNLART